MNRRRLLSGLTTGTLLPFTAGCLSSLDGSSPDSTTTEADDPSDTDDFRRAVSVVAVDDVPNEVPVALDVRVVQPHATTEQTARLETTVTNAGDADDRFPPAYYKGASSEGGLLLYSTRAPDGPDPDSGPDCVGTSGKSADELAWTTEGVGPVQLEPDESTTEELLVADDPTTVGCVPTGRYRFETRYAVGDPEDGRTFDWGFTLRVEAGGRATTR
ncbi:hypothetical protein ACFO0N_08905 [Halobium salinum]|uniref:Secreted protein n=1 Tax=Halobium salinum TaxID=1364940 RepID=A0ABD5PBI8_9EURY|nr:hypothetical protein [Halobium salinum]